MPKPARFRVPGAPTEWNRRRLQVLLACAVATAVAVIAGGVWSVRPMIGGDHPTNSAVATEGGRIVSPRDQLAAAPLPTVSLEDAQPGPLSTGSAGTIEIPQPRALGEAQVQTGFPRTPQGALAQLIAIDQRSLESASVVTAQDVIGSWAAPGGPTRRSWSGVRAVVVLLSSVGLPADGTSDLHIGLRPAMGLIKGSVGEDFVVPCVDFVLTISPAGAGATRVAVADCQRMVWDDGRWRIGPGAEPVSSPSIWPGTRASFDAGYEWLTVSP